MEQLVLCAGPVGEHVHRLVQLGEDVQAGDDQPQAAVLQPGEIQQLLHQAGEPLGLPDDDVHTLGRGLRAGALLQGFGPALDGGQGGAQLVRD